MVRRPVLAVLAAALLAPANPAAAVADHRVRVEGECGRGATSRLELKDRRGAIEVRFRVRHDRAGRLWRVALIHERRVVWRGERRMRLGRGVRLRRWLADYSGADTVTVRALGPRGLTCVASATLVGS